MLHGKKYRLSPQRGLPLPTGRLAGAIDAPQMGAFEEPWPEEEARYARLPAPRYLQSRSESLDEVQQAARIQRFLQQAGERTRGAYGPGAQGGLPPVDAQAGGGEPGGGFGAGAAGFATGYGAAPGFPTVPGDADAGLPLIAKPHGARQVYGASFASGADGSSGGHEAGADAGGLGGGLTPGLRAPWDEPVGGDFAGGEFAVGIDGAGHSLAAMAAGDRPRTGLGEDPGRAAASDILAGARAPDTEVPFGLQGPSTGHQVIQGVLPEDLHPLPGTGYEASQDRREWTAEIYAGPLGPLDV